MSQQPDECCKVGRGLRKYDLDDFDDRMRYEYLEGDASLRDLELMINAAFVAQTLEEDTPPAENTLPWNHDPADTVQLLSESGDYGPADCRQHEAELESVGVDPDELKSDFVTHQTIKTHLNKCLSTDTSRDSTIDLETAENIFGWARTKCVRVIEDTVQRMARANLVSAGTINVGVSVRISCSECGSQQNPSEFIRNRGCDCDTD